LLHSATTASSHPQDLATGYMSGKLLLKLEAVHFMLGHHTSAYYSFLDHAANSRNRTCYYNTLARLLFMEDAPSRFKAFMTPLQSVSGPSPLYLAFLRTAFF
jgi:exportin-7